MNAYMDRKREKRSRIIKEIINYLFTILVALFLAFCFVYFIFQTTTVIGDSMSPALANQEKVILSRSAYMIKKPKRYDIIKFTIKKSDSEHEYIKRVIALPGETVQIKNGMLYIDGKKRNDLPFSETIVSAGVVDKKMKLANNEYFVMGDNCNNSEDSRFVNVGAITKDEISGKIIAKVKGIKISKVK